MRLAAAAATIALACAPVMAGPNALTRAIDPALSRATFSVTHLYVTKVTGGIPISAGTFVLPTGSLVPLAIEATLDARHIDTHDPDRDDSLQGPDWFDTKRFAQWTFTSTSIEPLDAGRFTVEGTLTVHGVSQTVRMTATASGTQTSPRYHAEAHLDRHAFGLRRTPLDGTIGNDLTVDLDVGLKG